LVLCGGRGGRTVLQEIREREPEAEVEAQCKRVQQVERGKGGKGKLGGKSKPERGEGGDEFLGEGTAAK